MLGTSQLRFIRLQSVSPDALGGQNQKRVKGTSQLMRAVKCAACVCRPAQRAVAFGIAHSHSTTCGKCPSWRALDTHNRRLCCRVCCQNVLSPNATDLSSWTHVSTHAAAALMAGIRV